MTVKIDLENEEALVLFDLLASERVEREIPSLETAERHALSALEAQLEKVLVAPLSPKYSKVLAQARETLIRRYGP